MNRIKKTGEDILGLWSLVKGLKITGAFFFSKQVTVHYPRACVDHLATFRGPLELVPDPDDPARPLCIACMTCVTTCPTGAVSEIKRKAAKPDEGAADKGRPAPHRGPAKFRYAYTLCCQCGLCVENCPKGAIRLSGDPFSAGTRKGDFEVDLLEKLNNRNPITDNAKKTD